MSVSIIAPAGGRKNYIAHEVPISKLIVYSKVAKFRYAPSPGDTNPVGWTEKRNWSNANEFDLGPDIDEGFARTFATLVKHADLSNPPLVTLELFGKDRSFEELARIWRVIGHGFKLPRELHDETIRDDTRFKMYETTPFEFYHFKLIAETLDFDRGIVHSAMDRVTFLHVKGYLNDKTKMEIEEYCKNREGYWDSILDTLGRVTEKIEGAAKAKAAREERQHGKIRDCSDKGESRDRSKAKGNDGRGAQRKTGQGKPDHGKGKGNKENGHNSKAGDGGDVSGNGEKGESPAGKSSNGAGADDGDLGVGGLTISENKNGEQEADGQNGSKQESAKKTKKVKKVKPFVMQEGDFPPLS